MPRNTLLLVLLLLLSACQGNKSSVGLTERFVVTDRLPSQQIRAFAEDSRGYVWIGTYGALCRYNGQTYNQYFMDDDSLANRNFSVNCLMADESENLWIGTIGGLYCFRYGPGFSKVSDEYAHIICDSPTGYILFDNMSSVWRVDKKTMEVTEFHSYDSGTQTYGHIITDKFGKCWICDGEELTCKDIVSGDVEARIGIRGTVQSALSVGNNIFLSTDKDFFCLDPYSKRLAETGEFHRVYEELKSEEIGGMFPLNENSFFIYTKEPRLYVYSSKGIRVWSSDKLSLLSSEINHEYELSTLFIDSKKNF